MITTIAEDFFSDRSNRMETGLKRYLSVIRSSKKIVVQNDFEKMSLESNWLAVTSTLTLVSSACSVLTDV